MTNKEVAHIAALEPAKSNTGFVGTINLSGDTKKSFAVLLADEADGAQRAAIVGAAHEQLRALRPEPTPYERVSSKLRRAFGLRQAFRQPKDVTLKSVKQVESALRKGIEAPGDSFIILCRSRECYAALCAAIGITRTDHMVNAELSSLLDNEKPKKNKVVGRAHRLHDHLSRQKKKHRIVYECELDRLSKDMAEKGRVIRGVTNRFLEQVPKVPKFLIRDDPAWGEFGINFGNPDFYHLPFDACLIETRMDGAEDEKDTSIFFLANKVDAKNFSAEIMFFAGSGSSRETISPFTLEWDVSGAQLSTNVQINDDPEENYSNAEFGFLIYLMHAVERINNPQVSLVLNEAPKARPVSIGKHKRSPFYDCYDVSLPSSGSGVRCLGDAFASGRVVRAHERIRHQRTYKHPRYVNVRGKTVWINSTQVGDPKNGVVAKGYNLSSAP